MNVLTRTLRRLWHWLLYGSADLGWGDVGYVPLDRATSAGRAMRRTIARALRRQRLELKSAVVRHARISGDRIVERRERRVAELLLARRDIREAPRHTLRGPWRSHG